jgi:ribonuclease BN (tRNA processing enzyme)
MYQRTLKALIVAGFLAVSTTAVAAPAPHLTFTTLGTNSGPIPNPDRSEPASLVRFGDQAMLVDVGDGAGDQLAKAGVRLDAIRTILISHLHFDHTGGLFGFLGMRYQSRFDTQPLTIYGPPGTKVTVDALLEAMKPGIAVAGSIRGAGGTGQITVVEIEDGAKFTVGAVTVTAAENTHYAQVAGAHPGDGHPVSLAYRFDAPGRSILFTGDTGPSDKVAALCHGADLLVSEIMDPVEALARLHQSRPELPQMALDFVGQHFRKEHLSPDEVGLLAQRCGAGAVVLTHDAVDPEGAPAARTAIAAHYKGRVTFARDLQVF